MKLQIERPHVEALVSAFPALSALQDQQRLGNRVAKYCQHKDAAPTLAVFERGSIFRGMDLDEDGLRP